MNEIHQKDIQNKSEQLQIKHKRQEGGLGLLAVCLGMYDEKIED